MCLEEASERPPPPDICEFHLMGTTEGMSCQSCTRKRGYFHGDFSQFSGLFSQFPRKMATFRLPVPRLSTQSAYRCRGSRPSPLTGGAIPGQSVYRRRGS